MRYLENRITRLERYQEETNEDSAVTIRAFLGCEQDTDPEPGTRILHIELDRPSWWGVVDDNGVERWVRNA